LKQGWKAKRYREPIFKFKVRDKEIGIQTHTESLRICKSQKSLYLVRAWGDLLKWQLQENVPGSFLTRRNLSFQKRRRGSDKNVRRGGRPGTNQPKIHYVSMGLPAKRLSTAFDSVTLYGTILTTVRISTERLATPEFRFVVLTMRRNCYSGFKPCRSQDFRFDDD